MMLTFGQYNTLAITRQRVTRNQLALQTEFNDLMLTYYITGLLSTGLVTAIESTRETCYELTATGMNCLADYERQNPELTLTRALNSYSLGQPGY